MVTKSAANASSLNDAAQGDLLARGFSRRSFARVLGLLAAAPALGPALSAPAMAQSMPKPGAVGASVLLGSNECWTGPLAPSVAAAAASLATANRYTTTQRDDLVKTVAGIENVPPDYVMVWPGSSDPLARVIVSFTSPTRCLVTADPTFELAESAATWLGVKTIRVPLRADLSHDVQAMVAAAPNAGVYYVCTPNNPSSTPTRLSDVEWLLANKPAGSIVLLDEAYLHFSDTKPGSYLAAQNKDVVILRTFSKLFGMAGMRMGLTIARPDLGAKLMRYDGDMASYALPNASVVAATAGLTATDLIRQRREEMIRVRTDTLAFLQKRGWETMPSHANFFMIDWKTRPAKAVQAAFAEQGVAIGRSWPIWPNRSRITVGSGADMEAFKAALVKLNL